MSQTDDLLHAANVNAVLTTAATKSVALMILIDRCHSALFEPATRLM